MRALRYCSIPITLK